MLRPVGQQVGWWGERLVGRFTSPDRDDIFLYRSGTQAEVLYHPIF